MSKDPFAILDQADHMRGMEKVEMRIVDMWQPFANLVRVKGRINPTDSKMWQKPNVAVRIDVETIEGMLFPMKIALFQRFSLPMKPQYRQFTRYYNNGPKAQKQNYI